MALESSSNNLPLDRPEVRQLSGIHCCNKNNSRGRRTHLKLYFPKIRRNVKSRSMGACFLLDFDMAVLWGLMGDATLRCASASVTTSLFQSVGHPSPWQSVCRCNF